MKHNLDDLDPLPLLGERATKPQPVVEQPKPRDGQLVIDPLWWAFPIVWYSPRPVA
jgi:hypothetical protein